MLSGNIIEIILNVMHLKGVFNKEKLKGTAPKCGGCPFKFWFKQKSGGSSTFFMEKMF